jgi:hypothetical protein
MDEIGRERRSHTRSTPATNRRTARATSRPDVTVDWTPLDRWLARDRLTIVRDPGAELVLVLGGVAA